MSQRDLSPVSRRTVLGGVTAGIGAVAAGAWEVARPESVTEDATPAPVNGSLTIPFYGPHQAGIEHAPQAHQNLLGLRLRLGSTADDLKRMLAILTDDAARLTQGKFALGDSEPGLAMTPAKLTITFGFGAEVVRIVRGAEAVPTWLPALPSFSIDQLRPEYTGGDLLLQVAADDPITVAHATRMLLKDTKAFATLAWNQQGFRPAVDSLPAGTTMRNLMGQVDGTVNPTFGTPDFAGLVWRGDDWLDGGTTMVVRRIEMLLDKWDRLDRAGREASVGRRMDNGAPLTGTNEHDIPDFDAVSAVGFPVIPEFAHVRRAAAHSDRDRIFRRGYNYDVVPTDGGISNSGLIFTSFQADLEAQFLPIQQRLAELDLLNEWTVPIGSAVFAIPPGPREGEIVGAALFG